MVRLERDSRVNTMVESPLDDHNLELPDRHDVNPYAIQVSEHYPMTDGSIRRLSSFLHACGVFGNWSKTLPNFSGIEATQILEDNDRANLFNIIKSLEGEATALTKMKENMSTIILVDKISAMPYREIDEQAVKTIEMMAKEHLHKSTEDINEQSWQGIIDELGDVFIDRLGRRERQLVKMAKRYRGVDMEDATHQPQEGGISFSGRGQRDFFHSITETVLHDYGTKLFVIIGYSSQTGLGGDHIPPEFVGNILDGELKALQALYENNELLLSAQPKRVDAKKVTQTLMGELRKIRGSHPDVLPDNVRIDVKTVNSIPRGVTIRYADPIARQLGGNIGRNILEYVRDNLEDLEKMGAIRVEDNEQIVTVRAEATVGKDENGKDFVFVGVQNSGQYPENIIRTGYAKGKTTKLERGGTGNAMYANLGIAQQLEGFFSPANSFLTIKDKNNQDTQIPVAVTALGLPVVS